MRTRDETYLFQYGVALLATVAAIAGRWALAPWLADAHPLSLMYAAVAIAVWYGGIGPALFTCILGYLLSDLLFIDPSRTLLPRAADVPVVAVYALTCITIMGLGQATRSARSRIGAILESITECFFALDRNWRFTYVNGAAERYFSRSRHSLLGRVMWDAFPMLKGTEIERQYRKCLAEGVPTHFEVESPVYHRWLDVHAYPSQDGLTIVFSDMTERRQAEQLAARHASFLRLVTDSANVLIAYFDTDRRFRFVNRGFEEGFSVTRDAVVGRTAEEALGASEAAAMRPHIERALAGESSSSEITVHGPGGRERYLLANYQPDRGEQGAVRGVVLAMSDISDRIAAERALREADRRKDEFLAMLAHELRNPLAPILNATQLLRLEGHATPQQVRLRDIIDRQVRHMARIVDDLLDVSRVTLGRINLHPEEVQLDTVISAAVESSRPVIDASRHELRVDLPPEPVYLMADVTRLTQVFLNLLNNAAKYTPPGGKIHLSAVREGELVRVSVKDTGVGIPPQMVPRIFDIFTQVDRSLERTQGGLGLGLTLASRLVEMHGGRLEAHSEGLGKGSEFIVYLPVISKSERPPEKPRADLSASGAPTRRRVLVVDDNVDAAASLNMLLQASGHETRMAHDGLEAVKAAAEFRPDVVLLDIGLPRLNGYDAARRIRAEQGADRPMVVALTGWGQDEDRQRAAEAGIDLHLTKPVDPVKVMELVGDARATERDCS